MKSPAFIVILALLLTGCSGGTDDNTAVPTRVALESTTKSTVDATAEALTGETALPPTGDITVEAVTLTPRPPTVTATATLEPTATFVPAATSTPNPTADTAGSSAASATAAIVEAPRFSTLTPLPSGAIAPTGAPQVAADVLITQQQFQEELDLAIGDDPAIDSAFLTFDSGENPGIRINLVAYGGEALTNGSVFVAFQLSGDFVAIRVTDISVGSGEPPQRYIDVVNDILYAAVINAFDRILTQRLGETHDLQSLTMTERGMEIMLLVPR
ncbi:MAG: hypothetical protein H7Y09_11525 [Chitinophagaceae bacterium]|nr:hypothetical protein [Anaerolineae bacterium]